MRLADFTKGLVPGIKWPKLRTDPSGTIQIQNWIKAGKLISPGNNTPDPLMDWLIVAETPKKPKAAPEPVKHSWPYLCGQMRRNADAIELETWNKTGKGPKPQPTPNPCIGITGQRWQAGYDGKPEPGAKGSK